MGAKRPPAVAEKAYIEIDLDLYRTTQKIVAIGDPIIAPTITTHVPRGKFEITYTSELFGILEKLGNKKIQVLSYILDNKDGNNTLNMTNTQLSKQLGVARQTVIETLHILEDANLVKRQNSVLMINPGLMVKGNQIREAWLMRRYQEIEEIEPNIQAIDAEIDPQFAFTADGQIVQFAK